MKKIISLALTLCMVISLFVAAIPVHAEVTLPDETITVEKEVTKTVSLEDMKILSATSTLIDATDNTIIAGASIVDSDEIEGGKALKFDDEEAAAGKSGEVVFYYPLSESQVLKTFSYTMTYDESYYPYPVMKVGSSIPLYRNIGSKHSCGKTDTTGTCAARQTVANVSLTSAQIATKIASSDNSIVALGKGSGSGCLPGTFTPAKTGTAGNLATTANTKVKYTVDYSGEAPTLTVLDSTDTVFTHNYEATTDKYYPMAYMHIQVNKNANTGKISTYYVHFSDFTITYTEEVSVKEDVEAFVEANPLSLEIRNGLKISDIPSAKLEEYATKAASLKENFAAASAELQGILKDYGYYDESLVDLIVNVKNVAATLPDATITSVKEVTKTVSITDFEVLALYSNKQGYLTSFDNSYIIDSTVISGGKALSCPSDNTIGSEWEAYFWYPLTANQTLKEMSFKVSNATEGYVLYATNNATKIFKGRYGSSRNGVKPGKQRGAYNMADADGVVTENNTLDGLISSDSSAMQKFSGSIGWSDYTPIYTPDADEKTFADYGISSNTTYDVAFSYESLETSITIKHPNGATLGDTFTDGEYKAYPLVYMASKWGKAYHISDITITYTEPVDVKAQVAEFVAANPFALDIRNDNIDLTGDLSQYKDSATALTAAYNAADENLQATLTQYGYYDEDVINVILGGADAINEYKTEHSVALGISALAVKDIAASYDTYKALYDAAVADLSSVESYIELGMGADIEPALDAAEASLAEALKYKGYADLIADGTLKYQNDFEGEETLEQVHSLTYPYDENKAAFADNGKEYVNTTNKTYDIPEKLKGFDINTSSKAFGLENRFYYKVYGRDDLRFANQYSANKYLWAAAKENGLSLDRVTGIFNVGGSATSWAYAPAIIYSYTDANHYSLISINGIGPNGTTLNAAGMSAGNFKVEEYVYDADNTENPLTLVKAYPTITIGRVAETDDETTDGWIKFSFAYNEDGTAQFTFINGGQIYSVSTQNTTSAENKFFAMAKLTGVNINNLANPIYYGGRLYVDNLEIVFEEDENLAYYAKANDYRVEWEEIFLRNADFVAPYDVAEITAAKAAYDSLDDKVKAHLTNEGVTAKLTALVNAAAKWDVTDDASIVASYKTNFASIDASNYKIAYNVYNRLTAAQKAELKSEYEAMLSLFAAETQVANTTDIVVMGDSNTAGYGVTTNNDKTKRWTSLLENKLGSDYTVSNGGISGYRLVNDTANIEGIQFRDAESVLWVQSHTMNFDMVVVALGTNDASLIINQERQDKWEALYEEFVQSYLALENSPTLVLANFGRTKNLTSTERDTGFARVNAVIKNIADKYGITLIDIDAMYDVNANLFQNDNLHWNEAGHEWMAGHYEKAITDITANAYSLAGQKVFYDYSAEDITATVNGFVPEILGGTIKNRLDNQDMRFAVNMSKNVPVGKEVAEYGMILADYRNITSGALSLADLNVGNTEDARVIIGKSKEASNNDLGTTYYVNVGGISEEDYGAPIIARAYVKFTDGSVVYSVATTDGADYAARTGVKDGYAVRSIISITKAMLVYLDAQSVDVSSVAKIENGVITAYITAEGQESNVPDDAKRLFSLLQNNISYLANK